MAKQQKKPQGSTQILLTLQQQQPKTNDFHWTPDSQEVLRKFLAKCALEFGGRKAGKVLTVLVDKWINGEVEVSLESCQ